MLYLFMILKVIIRMVENDITLGIAIATNNNDYIVAYDGNDSTNANRRN